MSPLPEQKLKDMLNKAVDFRVDEATVDEASILLGSDGGAGTQQAAGLQSLPGMTHGHPEPVNLQLLAGLLSSAQPRY